MGTIGARTALLTTTVVAVLTIAPAGARGQPVDGPSAGPRHGVAVDLGSIRIDAGLGPGTRHVLPPMRVRNPGTVETSYLMAGRPGGTGTAITPEWLTFVPTTFTLAPGSQQVVTIKLDVPPGAAAGTYTALLAAQIADPGDPGRGDAGARVGAAAASQLEFDVVPGSRLSDWLQWLWRMLTSLGPLGWIALAGIALLGGRWWFTRNFRVRLERIPHR